MEERIKEHLRKFSPKYYRDLKAAGTLDRTAEKMWTEASRVLSAGLQQGLPYNMAWEPAREIAFPESEQEEAKKEREIQAEERQMPR